jgi:hypothetical protein
MIRLMKQYHVRQGGDTWVITVNPRHRSFYAKALGYAPLGGVKAYAAVADAPAEAFWLDLDQMKTNAPRGYEQVFGAPLPAEALQAPSLPRPFIRYFGSESTQTDESRLDSLLDTVRTNPSSRRW